MNHIANDLDAILDGWMRERNQARATAGLEPLAAPKVQTVDDLVWAAGPKGALAKLGMCVCLDGFRVQRIDGVDYAVKCECAPLRLACQRYSEAGVPTLAGVPGRSLQGIEQDKARGLDWARYEGRPLGVLKAWLRDAVCDVPKQPALLLSGKTGTGKTHIAAGIVRSLLFCDTWRTGQASARWVRWRDYLDACKGDRDRRDELRNVRLLVVDELSPCAGEWGATELEDLLDARATACRSTVLTTNIDVGSLASAIGARAESRLVGAGCVIDLVAPDYRKAAA